MSNDRRAQVSSLADRFIDLVAEQQTHQVVLEALISTYAAVAAQHPCCAQNAADLARHVADFIETTAAPAGAAHIH